ncbi:MAG: phosphatidate cytidylyltransferase [Anaerocolumna sp.]
MFWTRFRSSIILMAIAITVCVLGGNYLFATIGIISVIGLMELYRTIQIHKSPVGFVGYVSAILYFTFVFFDLHEYYILLMIGCLLLFMFVYVFTFPKYHIQGITLAFFGVFYVAVMLSYVYKIRILEDGAFLVWLIFIGAWGSDTCAYCVGMLFGKTKFLPKLSPKKSLEGCVGGVVGAALLGFVYATLFRGQITGIANPSLTFAIICGCSSVISQLGDLAASAIKRNYEIKDYGKLIPGHGGILDRFDSIIFVAPIVYVLALVLR